MADSAVGSSSAAGAGGGGGLLTWTSLLIGIAGTTGLTVLGGLFALFYFQRNLIYPSHVPPVRVWRRAVEADAGRVWRRKRGGRGGGSGAGVGRRKRGGCGGGSGAGSRRTQDARTDGGGSGVAVKDPRVCEGAVDANRDSDARLASRAHGRAWQSRASLGCSTLRTCSCRRATA